MPNGEVPLYGRFEHEINFYALKGESHGYPDPFYGVGVNAIFTSPSDKDVNWIGFFDGDGNGGQDGNIWKLRFMPGELGTWTFTWNFSDGSLSGRGSFIVKEASRKPGPLKQDPSIPQRLITADQSRHIFPNMYLDWRASWPDPYIDYNTKISEAKSRGFDCMALWSTIYLKSKPKDATNPMIWLDPDDDDYTPRLQGWHLLENGLYQAAYDQELYLYQWDGFYSGNSLYKLHGQPESFQNKVLKYWLAREAAYYNLLYNIGFEISEYQSVPSWPESRARFIKDNDPFGHLITAHQSVGKWSYGNANSNMDLSALQDEDYNHYHQRALEVWNSPSKPHPPYE